MSAVFAKRDAHHQPHIIEPNQVNVVWPLGAGGTLEIALSRISVLLNLLADFGKLNRRPRLVKAAGDRHRRPARGNGRHNRAEDISQR